MVKSYTLRLRTVTPYRETGNAKLASHLNLAAIWSSHSSQTQVPLPLPGAARGGIYK